MVSAKKDCIGGVLSTRPAMNSDAAISLVGFLPKDTTQVLRAGAHCLQEDAELTMATDQG